MGPTQLAWFAILHTALPSYPPMHRSTWAPRSAPCMKIRVGILGLPNVGKSTLFNALVQQSIAQAANFPFCTIEPNVAPVAVPDAHLQQLGSFAGSQRTVSATMDWVDVAGLAKGAHRGEGLGNRFLATARECDAICHVLRVFDDPETIHVDGRVDPVADAEVVNLELILADLAHVERRLEKVSCKGKERETLEAVAAGLQRGVPARTLGLSEAAALAIRSMGLLTLKPVLYAFNVDEIDLYLAREEATARASVILNSIQYCDPTRDAFTLVSAKVEAEVSARSKAEQREYLDGLGIAPTHSMQAAFSYHVLPSMVRSLLGLAVVYTGPGVPPQRSRTTKAHMFRRGTLTAAGLAARIHGEIQRGFVCAEVVPALALLEHASFSEAKQSGCIRTEGKDYLVCDSDVVLVKWST